MTTTFSHPNAPLIAQDFGTFVEMVPANSVNMSSRNLGEVAFLLGWNLDSQEGGTISNLSQFIENCCIVTDGALGSPGDIVVNYVRQLRVLAQQAAHYGESITYG